MRVTAWGRPAVVLRCGVPPAGTEAGDHVTADGVTWLTPGQTGDVVMWTSEGYAPGLELSVPSSINDQQNILAELAPAVTRCLRLIPAPSLSVSSVRP